MGNKKIALFGGTFDPIHLGHLIMAEYVRESLELDKVVFIPSGNPPHKKGKKVTDEYIRYKMVELAVKGNDGFAVSDIELNKDTYSYTYKTLQRLKAEYDDISIVFIIGADTVLDILTWKEYEKVFKLCSFVAVARPGYDESEVKGMIARLEDTYHAHISIVETPLIGISSTEIKNRIAEGKTIKYMLTDDVIEFINKNNLYKNV